MTIRAKPPERAQSGHASMMNMTMIAERPRNGISKLQDNNGCNNNNNNNSKTVLVTTTTTATVVDSKSEKAQEPVKTESRAGKAMSPKTVIPQANVVCSPATVGTTSHNLLESQHRALKVVKGEIHNVLTVLRADYASAARFTSECNDQHAVVTALQKLRLSDDFLNTTDYLKPFCAAIRNQEISAKATASALGALHKFLLYGFLTHRPGHMRELAHALLHCSFEAESPTNTPSSKRKNHHAGHAEEPVVLQYLSLCALLVRSSLQSAHVLLQAVDVVGLLDGCLHVSHRAPQASAALQQAAAEAAGDIVLAVFAATGVSHIRSAVLKNLCQLLLPKDDFLIDTTLHLMNVALETCRERWTDPEIALLHNDVCKHLLPWTGRNVPAALQAKILRVIFNLFQADLRNALKVQTEIFLTSVHLRWLQGGHSADAQEVALESLLEFCQEPALMQDLYRNYDCDVACTNLYEAIVTSLAKTAQSARVEGNLGQNSPQSANSVSANNLQTSQRGVAHTRKSNSNVSGGGVLESPTVVSPTSGSSSGSVASSSNGNNTQSHDTSQTLVVPSAPLNRLNHLAVDGLLAILDSIASRCYRTGCASFASLESYNSSDDLPESMSEQELQHRKRRKHSLMKVAEAFNSTENTTSTEWLDVAIEAELLHGTPMENAAAVAELLHTAPGLDKAKLGLFLSKGPVEDYPFHADVRTNFVKRYDFAGMSFATALRVFLSKFRLPGEAQCIDRLMEAFSKELYEQQADDTIFQNADAVYVLSFSTIMLNTDLHNPTIKEEQRMTVNQFLRNNRGINGGQDLPEDFLIELYTQIKERQIQVRREVGEFMKINEDFRTVWDGVIHKSKEVATPFFTPEESARRVTKVGTHDKEMFAVLSKPALKAFANVFLRTGNDEMVIKALRAMHQIAKVAAFFEMNDIINDVIGELLPHGRDYIVGCITIENSTGEGNVSVVTQPRTKNSGEEDDPTSLDSEQPVPIHLLSSSRRRTKGLDFSGSAAHRGLLALDAGFVLLRRYSSKVSECWPLVIECVCALKDAKALPPGIGDLDDFADSSGNALPPSAFATEYQKRIVEFYKSQTDKDTRKKKGWFRSFFRKKPTPEYDDSNSGDELSDDQGKEISTYAKILRGLVVAVGIDSVMHIKSDDLIAVEQVIESLLASVAKYPFDDDPLSEQSAVLALEVAARGLLNNRKHAEHLFLHFLTAFESIFSKVTENSIPAPFFLERVVVTILRSSIHLYEVSELRSSLRVSLHLLTMSLPKTFVRELADRIACGLAIILRASFQHFEGHNEWVFLGDTLDMLAQYNTSRVFVFDGIASTVEYALHSSDDSSRGTEDDGDRLILTKEACQALSKILIRFVLGFYQNDKRLVIPAMLCLEKVYRHTCCLLLDAVESEADSCSAENDSANPKLQDVLIFAPDKEFWQNVAVAVYSVCRSPDPDVSARGVECFQRIFLQTKVSEIADEKWIAVLYLMVTKQPPLAADVSRGNAFSILGQLMIKVLPSITHNPDNNEDLVDFMGQVASVARDNLRHGRRGTVTPLFEQTLQTVTYLSNHLVSDEWEGESEFSAWASETLLAELERVGAAGATIKNQAAIQPAKPILSDNTNEESDGGGDDVDESESSTQQEQDEELDS